MKRFLRKINPLAIPTIAELRDRDMDEATALLERSDHNLRCARYALAKAEAEHQSCVAYLASLREDVKKSQEW